MESFGDRNGGGVGAGSGESAGGGSNVSRQRPNSFNYMGVRGGGVDMGLLKNQLRKTSSREMLAEKEGDEEDMVGNGEEGDDDDNHRRRTVEETRKSLEDLSATAAAAAADKESWKTKSCEHLLGGKSRKSKKESKLPPGWTKNYDAVAERDVYLFTDGVSWEEDVVVLRRRRFVLLVQ